MGTWEYRQANRARPTGVDAEGERIVFRRGPDGRIVVEYFGLERMGEHGLFYTAVEAKGLQVDRDGAVNLTIPERTLFRIRPESLADAATRVSAGVTRYELTLSGRLADGNLVLSCASRSESCPDSRMVFRRTSSSAR